MKSSVEIPPASVLRYSEDGEVYTMNAVSIWNHSTGGPFEDAWNEGRFEILELLPAKPET